MKRLALFLVLFTVISLLLGGEGCKETLTPGPTVPTETPTLLLTTTKSPTYTPKPATDTPATPTPAPTVTTHPNLFVTFIDVGQGDSILIQSPDGKVMLIDGGERDANVVAYLQKQGIKQIDVLVATHPHSDHIGGLTEVLRQIQVKQVWTNGQAHTTKTFEDFLVAIDKSGAKYNETKRGDIIALGDLKLPVLNPGSPLGDDMNHNTIVLRLVYGQIGFLFTGDADTLAESQILAAKLDVKATILKVGHHGSQYASSIAFLKAVAPEIAIYSAGAGNPYGHPNPDTLARLDQLNIKVYGTDKYGTIVVSTNGQSYQLKTTRGG